MSDGEDWRLRTRLAEEQRDRMHQRLTALAAEHQAALRAASAANLRAEEYLGLYDSVRPVVQAAMNLVKAWKTAPIDEPEKQLVRAVQEMQKSDEGGGLTH